MLKYILFALCIMVTPAYAAGLKVGDKAPDFTLSNAHGQYRTLSEMLKKGPVIINFYRGEWCPYCNDQLAIFQENLPQITEKGAQLVAISPTKPESMVDHVLANDLQFEILSDLGNKVIRDYDLVWYTSDSIIEKTSEYVKKKTGQSLAEYNGVEVAELPIPGTFVVNQDGIVTYAYVNEDYKQRAPISDVLAALEELAQIEPAAK